MFVTTEGQIDQQTPFFLLDVEELPRQVAAFRAAFPSAELYYALKANSEPTVLRALAMAGCGFEAASWQEIDLLLKLDINAERIIYGTAVKPPSHIRQAVLAGVSRFAADSFEEVDLLAHLAPKSRVFVRARVDDSHSVFQSSSKFGAPVHQVPDLVRHLCNRDLVPWGVSFNVGSQATHTDAWARGIQVLAPVLDDLFREGLQLEVLNLGGGFPTRYDNHPDASGLRDIAASVWDALAGLPYQPQLIMEPGRGLVATSTTLVSSVIARIERPDGCWLYLDAGVYNALFEAMVYQGQIRYPVRLLDGAEPGLRDALRPFVLAGPTGDAIDVIARSVELPATISVGDRLQFGHAGAYTIALASRFNGFAIPPVHVVRPSGRRHRIDTRATRLAIGFPEDPREWCRAPASLNGEGLRILGHPVMQDWERDYMQALAKVATSRGGTVLELGYGLGLSTAAIQAAPGLVQHVLIECHPDVTMACIQHWREAIASQRLQLHIGLWQEVTPHLADHSFEGILFDTYPLTAQEIHRNHFSFFHEAFRLLKPGGVFTYYSDESETLSEEHLAKLIEAGFSMEEIHSVPYPVNPLEDCDYWQELSLVVPIVGKRGFGTCKPDETSGYLSGLW